jgi:hypothetical protein
MLRLGNGPRTVRIGRGALPWTTITRPDLLERGDVPFGDPTDHGVTVTLDAPITAVRLTQPVELVSPNGPTCAERQLRE